MNYRHAFHAGNFADLVKHVVLVRILQHLRRKDTPFRAIDTHAGKGLYDLAGDEAGRTAEWVDGVGRLEPPFPDAVEGLIAPYRDILETIRARHGGHAYPGSPLVIRELLRPQDRAVLAELHPVDGAELAAQVRSARTIKVLQLDGWTALHALIPPRERRGVVLIDPPYEEPGELERLGGALLRAVRKWPTGIYAGWYPIKDMGPVERVAERLAEASPRPGLRLEVLVDDPSDSQHLNGCGLFVVNPPWTFKDEADLILPALAERLARARYGAYRCEWLAGSAAAINV